MCIHGSLDRKIKRWRWHQSHFGLLQNTPLQFAFKTTLFNRVEVATLSKDLLINFEFLISAEYKLKSFYEYHAQIKKSRIGNDINKLWLPFMEIKLAGAIGLALRTNNGVTDDEVNTGVRTIRQIYRAHNRKMDCLKILYPTLPFLHPTKVIMVVTIIDLEESEKEPKMAKPASR